METRYFATFQFQKVRLKAAAMLSPSKSVKFQFQKVRLKAVDIDNFAPLILNRLLNRVNGAKVLKNRRCPIIYFWRSFDNSVYL